MENMEKRLLIAIVLSLGVLFLFQGAFGKSKKTGPLFVKAATEMTSVNEKKETPLDEEMPGFEGDRTKTVGAFTEELEMIVAENMTIFVSNRGGNIAKIILNKYFSGTENEVLVEQKDPSWQMFSLQNTAFTGLSEKQYTKIKQPGKVRFVLNEPNYVEVTKTYTLLKDENIVEIEISIKNLANNPIFLANTVVGPSSLVKSRQISSATAVEARALVNDVLWKTTKMSVPKEKDGKIEWAALKNRYFTVAVKPEKPFSKIIVRETEEKEPAVLYVKKDIQLEPGQEHLEKYLLYAGALNEQKLMKIDESLQGLVDYGIFGGLSKILLSVLYFFHKWFKNWGLAVICLTVIVNLILFPLTVKSFSSMNKMKKIQPHMQKLRDLHKDNPQKLNKEMVELYRKYNVNPLGGCLPMLLQMPIFIALYQGLIMSVELKGAKFLWIQDLSLPDAVSLPMTVPVIGASLNILPLLMVLIMVVQQKISQGTMTAGMTEEQISQQKIMLVLMPLLFGFLFYNMPSGLVLYWLTNTILMAGEQFAISKKIA